MEGGGEEVDGEKKQGRRRRRRKRRSERVSLHEELLEFISREWAALDMAEVKECTYVYVNMDRNAVVFSLKLS